jgi:hypothetical protein
MGTYDCAVTQLKEEGIRGENRRRNYLLKCTCVFKLLKKEVPDDSIC